MVPPGGSETLMVKRSKLFAGLDGVPWERLSHHYGSAGDVPSLLRAAVRGDTESWYTLVNHLRHQGGAVFSAGPAVVPFLVRLAESADLKVWLRSEALTLIAELAEDGRRALSPRRVDAAWPLAWAEAVPRVTRLLGDPKAAVREAAALALAHAVHDADEVCAALRSAFAREKKPAVRVEIVRAVGSVVLVDDDHVVRSSCLPWLHGLVTHDIPEVRLAAVLALRRLEPEYRDPAHFTIAVEVLLGTEFTGRWPAVRAARATAKGLGEHRDERVALAERLIGHASARHRLAGLNVAGEALMTWRSAVSLLPAVASLLDDPHKRIRRLSVYLLAAAGPGAEPWADELAALVDDPDARVAEMAVWGLAHLGDERCVPAVRSYLTGMRAPYGTGGVRAGWDFDSRPALHHVLRRMGPFASDLLPAIRLRLHESGDGFERGSLMNAIGWWDPAVLRTVIDGEDLPEPLRQQLIDLLPRSGAPEPDPDAVRADIEAARAVLNDPMERLDQPDAAFTLWRLTGEHQPAVRLLVAELKWLRAPANQSRAWGAINDLGRIGPPAAVAVPALRAALEDDRRLARGGPRACVEDEETRADIRTALARIEGGGPGAGKADEAA